MHAAGAMASQSTAVASSILAALLAISSPAAAQTQPAQPQASPPAAQQGAPAEPAEKEPVVKEGSAPSAASLNANRRVQDPKQPLRIVGEVLLSLIGSGIGAYGGSLIAIPVLSRLGFNPGDTLFFSATIGGGIGAGLLDVLCVWVMGALVQGRGQFGWTLVGGLIGTALGVGLSVGATLLALMNP